MNPFTPERAAALVRWQHAAGPYWLYVCAAPFLGVESAGPARPGRPSRALLEAVCALPEDEPAAVFVDLPPGQTLPAREQLARLGFRVVPVIQRWVAAQAVLPCEELQSQLVRYAPQESRPAAERGVVFLLDGQRVGPTATPPPRRFDNRYAYPICRFPPPDLLRRQGVGGAYWLPAPPVAADLLPYAQLLTDGGLGPRAIPCG